MRAIHLDLPDRGRPLHEIWSADDAEVLAYMDVDRSTDLNALLPLVAPLLSGHSDVAIGTRLAHGSRVVPRLRESELRAPRGLARQVPRFAAIGVLSTLAYVVVYLALRGFMPAQAGNALSLLLTAIGNTAANRRLTFGVRGQDGAARQHFRGLIPFGICLVLTSGALMTLHAAAAAPDSGFDDQQHPAARARLQRPRAAERVGDRLARSAAAAADHRSAARPAPCGHSSRSSAASSAG